MLTYSLCSTGLPLVLTYSLFSRKAEGMVFSRKMLKKMVRIHLCLTPSVSAIRAAILKL